MSESVAKSYQMRVDTPVEPRKIDVLLRPFLQAADDADAELIAAGLISEYVRPVIVSVTNYKLGIAANSGPTNPSHADREDISSEVVLEVLLRLRELRSDADNLCISNFRSYVAAITNRACSEYLRRLKPQRARLKNRLRYILTHAPDLGLWATARGEWFCGLKTQQGRESFHRSTRVQQLLDDPQLVGEMAPSNGDFSNSTQLDQLEAIFKLANEPIAFDDLIRIIAELWGVKDQMPASAVQLDGVDSQGELRDVQVDVSTEVEQRIYLRHIWKEIRDLPPKQRSALLLNLKDPSGQSVIALLPIVGIASLHEIAAALEMSDERLAELWNDLPLEDAVIASQLRVTRQQVINLRKSARERLARRMKAQRETA
jgi:hypothetical protein